MQWMTSFFIAIGLAMDAFAVSLGVGTAGKANDFRSKFRMAFHFGFFQSMMTVIGWFAGSTISSFIEAFDHWIAFALLGFVGVNMIHSGFDPDGESFSMNPSKGKTLIVLCVATSIAAMAVGLSLAMVGTEILTPSVMIGIVTYALSAFGLYAGAKLGQKFGKRMEILGGIILIFIGVRVVVTHLFPTF